MATATPLLQMATSLKDAARQLANELFSTESVPCSEMGHGKPSCLTVEEDRPLTRAEKLQGWTRRPFSAYDPDRLCGGCRSYWYAEMAAQTLERYVAVNIRAEARTAQ